jgi:hypothetical protein
MGVACVADQLESLRSDASRTAAEMEPDGDPLLRAQAEADYIDAGLEQLAAELRGICTVCVLGELSVTVAETEAEARRWLN